MRLGVPDSKSINGELEFERDSGGGMEKSRMGSGDPAYLGARASSLRGARDACGGIS